MHYFYSERNIFYRRYVKITKVFLCFAKHHANKTYEEVEVYLHAFLSLNTTWK